MAEPLGDRRTDARGRRPQAHFGADRGGHVRRRGDPGQLDHDGAFGGRGQQLEHETRLADPAGPHHADDRVAAQRRPHRGDSAPRPTNRSVGGRRAGIVSERPPGRAPDPAAGAAGRPHAPLLQIRQRRAGVHPVSSARRRRYARPASRASEVRPT